ncbi:hypothetical protein O1611_g7614 [Lasiodiplodia mahajangana]|uniref:Uncharacterized protein n=1 Tax=Lasiodiplodia mahajangana TaxID=1108764 RepID=A0ACC2JFM8_9PEZI|nr:hypothetical protein O1611_g7614 [Lasiodiplodia mahajangana]
MGAEEMPTSRYATGDEVRDIVRSTPQRRDWTGTARLHFFTGEICSPVAGVGSHLRTNADHLLGSAPVSLSLALETRLGFRV